MIKHNDLDKNESEDLQTPQRKSDKLDVKHTRLRSLSAVSKRAVKQAEEGKKGKQKDSVLSKLFKNNKNDLAKIISKIDKFADKKVSNFMNLRKIKKKELGAFDFGDGFPQRYISRTFTGGFDKNLGIQLFQLNGSLLNQQSSTPFSGYQNSHMDFEKAASPAIDDSKEDDNNIFQNDNWVGDFYETKLTK